MKQRLIYCEVVYFSIMILLALVLAWLTRATDVIEEVLVKLDSIQDIKDVSRIENVQGTDDFIRLRGKTGGNSLVIIEDPLAEEEWSAEVSVGNIKMDDIQRAGIYMWYTAHPIKEGVFKGVTPEFDGIMAGIELSEGHTDIVLAINDGKLGIGHEIYRKYDRIPQHLVDESQSLTLKIIHTKKNFKVELHNEMRMLSDTLKIDNQVIRKDISEIPHYLGLSTDYRHCPDWIAFHLNQINILSRKESDNYSTLHINTKPNNFLRRKSDDEVRHTIAEIVHTLLYLDILMGTEQPNELEKIFFRTTDNIRGMGSSIDRGISESKERTAKTKGLHREEAESKFNALESDVERLKDVLDAMKNELELLGGNDPANALSVPKLLLFGCMACLFVTGLRCLTNRFYINTIANKKS